MGTPASCNIRYVSRGAMSDGKDHGTRRDAAARGAPRREFLRRRSRVPRSDNRSDIRPPAIRSSVGSCGKLKADGCSRDGGDIRRSTMRSPPHSMNRSRTHSTSGPDMRQVNLPSLKHPAPLRRRDSCSPHQARRRRQMRTAGTRSLTGRPRSRIRARSREGRGNNPLEDPPAPIRRRRVAH